MARGQRTRIERLDGTVGQAESDQRHRPCGKVIVRLRPLLQDELASGETQSALTTTRGGELKLKLAKTRNRWYAHKKSSCEGLGGGTQQQRRRRQQQQQQQQQQQHREEPPTVFQVDTVLGPGCDTSEVFAAAVSRLVDRTITGGNALLLVAGTPGSGRSHTLWGTLTQHDPGVTRAAAAAGGIEEQGLLPQALADLARRWRCGNGSPFYHSSAAASTAARFSSSSAASSSSSPLSFRLCAAEVLPGGLTRGSDEAGTTASATTTTTCDLLRDCNPAISCPFGGGGGGGGGNVRGRKASSSRSPSRWALSARDALAGFTCSSSPSPSPSPPRSSVGRNIGVGFKSRNSVGGGRGKGGAASDGALLTSRVLAGVTEVCAEGLEEALALVRKSLRGRRTGGHLVISAKLVAAGGDDKRVGTAPGSEGIMETGELVFVELGDCPSGNLPQTLRTALAHLKIGSHHLEILGPHTPPLARSSRAAVSKKKTATSTPLKTQEHGGDAGPNGPGGRPSSDPLLALLSALAGDGTRGVDTALESAVNGAAATTKTAAVAALTGTAAGGKGRAGDRVPSRYSASRAGATTAATAGEIGSGAGAAATRDAPLVVSVVATLRSGDGRYLEEKAVLEVLAKSSRTRPDSWRSRRLSRILVPSFSWRSSQPGSAAAAAAAAVAVADGSAPAPAVPVPSAPPAPSSEEVSLATSNSSNSHSASSSFSGCGEEAASAAAVAVATAAAAAAGAGLSSGGNDGDYSACPIPPSEAASSTAKVNGMSRVGGSAPCGGDGGGGGGGSDGGGSGGGFSRPAAGSDRLEERSSGGDCDGVDVLVTGGEDSSPRREARRRTSNSSMHRFSIEAADEVAEQNMKGTRNTQKEERRMSPPWDDSTLGLLGLAPDELIDRVLRAEKELRYWKAQHTLVERKLATLETNTDRRHKGSGSGGGGSGTACVSPVVGCTTSVQGSSASPADPIPEHPLDCSSCSRIEEGTVAHAEELPVSRENSSVIVPGTTSALVGTEKAQMHEYRSGGEGGGWGGSSCGGGKDEQINDKQPVSPGKTVVERARGKQPRLHVHGGGRGSGVETSFVHNNVAENPLRSTTVNVAAAVDIVENVPCGNTNTNINNNNNNNNNTPQQLTFKERRAVFSSNNSVPPPPVAASSSWPVAANTAVTVGKAVTQTPSPPRSSRTPPKFTAFSSSAVEAARQNLTRNKVPAKRAAAAAAGSCEAVATHQLFLGQAEGERGGERPRLSSGVSRSPSRAAVVSVSPAALLSQSASSAGYPGSPAPFTPPRPLHHRRSTAPSPPAPSPCSTADMYKSTPRSPDSAAESAGRVRLSSVSPSPSSWSSSSWQPPSPSTPPPSPPLVSPPSFPKPNAERRRARAQLVENGADPSSAVAVVGGGVGGDGGGGSCVEKPSSPECGKARRDTDVLVPVRQGGSSRCSQEQMEPARESAVSLLLSTSGGFGRGRPGTSDSGSQAAGIVGGKQQQQSRGTYGPVHNGGGRGSSPLLSPAQVKAISTSSSSMASAILDASAASATAASRPPPTAPTAVVPREVAVPAPAAAIPTPTPASDSGASRSSWSGAALRQKSVRLAASSLPSPVPEEGSVEAASKARGDDGEEDTDISHRSGGGGGRTMGEDFSNSKGLLAWPQDGVASFRSSFRRGGSGGGGGGGSGSAEDDWKERSPGVGTWPLLEQTREGRASLDEKQGVSNGGGGIGAVDGKLSTRGIDEKETKAAAAAAAVADPEVSIGNISTMQASRLRALREKMERRYSLARGTTSTTTAIAIPEGSQSSLDRPAHRGQGQEFVGKPWGSRQG